MTKEVEDIIKNKAYIELTADERKRVSEWAPTEEEYNNLQWFLTGTASAFASGKITASPDLKKNVMKHLTESKRKKGFWLNSVGVFMLPEGKKFYQKPAFQLGVAAVAVIGFLFFFNNDMTQNNLAVNDTVVSDSIQMDQIVEGVDQNDLNQQEQLLETEEEIEALDEDADLEPVANNEATYAWATDNDHANGLGLVSQEKEDNFELQIEELEMGAPEIAEERVMEVYDEESVADVSMDDMVLEKKEANTVADSNTGYGALKKVSEQRNADEIVMVSVEEDKLFKRERVKNKAVDGVERKDMERLAYSDAEPAGVDNVRNEDADAPGKTEVNNTNAGAVNSNGEWIVPKSMHINKTKELNQLFHIEK